MAYLGTAQVNKEGEERLISSGHIMWPPAPTYLHTLILYEP